MSTAPFGAGRASAGARRPAAFTLIELLIVVAIIAILAAIAVPNFIEAQARAKISRALADIRSCRTAIESYAVDNNKYPRHTWGCVYNDRYEITNEPVYSTLVGALGQTGNTGAWGGGANAEGLGGSITTPIAYIVTLPKDPFVIGGYSGPDYQYGADLFHFYSSWTLYDTRTSTCDASTPGYIWATPNPAQIRAFEEIAGKYLLLCIGPKASGGSYEDSLATNSGSFFVQYDPTNGTISLGSIFVTQRMQEPSYLNEASLRWWDLGPIGR